MPLVLEEPVPLEVVAAPVVELPQSSSPDSANGDIPILQYHAMREAVPEQDQAHVPMPIRSSWSSGGRRKTAPRDGL